MSKWTIAVMGKGGAGKTATITLMTKVLMQQREKLLIVDADPAMGLTNVLGIRAKKTLEDLRHEIIKVGGRGIEEEKEELVLSLDYKAMELIVEEEGFSVLVMGQPKTLGCFCPANTLLRSALKPLTKAYDTILLDCEAGLEQINRKVVEDINLLLIITDPTLRGLQTANAIREMAKKFTKASRIGLIINKVSDPTIVETLRAKTDLEILGTIPEDPKIREYDLIGRSLLELPPDSVSLKAITNILNTLEMNK
ncbi:MAG: AAA family ATPase [Candidatus Helarchaeota archaeon]|nr:AAA family ATPase [Candidatus Helarchaeota archaeon]